MKRFLPGIVLGVFLIYVGAAMFRPPVRSSEEFDVAEFGRLPVLMNGRVQPIDSVARLGLLQIRGTVTVPLENAKPWQLWKRSRTLSASEWLLELLTKPDAADARKIFPVRDPTLPGTLGLKAAADSGTSYFAFEELAPRLAEIGKQTLRISKVKAATRKEWERECLKLRNALVIYERLKNSLQPNSYLQREAGGQPIAYDFAARLAQYQIDLRAGLEAAIARQHGKQQELDKATEEDLRAFARPYTSVSRAGLLSVIPPADPARSRDRWQNIGTVLVDSARTGQLPPPVAHFAAMSSAFAQGKPAVFNGEVTKHRQWLRSNGLEPEVSRARNEFFYNRFQPFVRATAIYLVGFVLVGASRLRRSTALYRSAALIVVLAWVLHTAGLLFEMMVEGRPPIANAYSSIIFTGWGVALLALAAERFSRKGIGMATAALAGLMTLSVAHGLAPGGGVELMRAVLDIGFWLAVVAVMIALRLGRNGGKRPVPSVTKPRNEPARKAARWGLGRLLHVRSFALKRSRPAATAGHSRREKVDN